MISKCYDTAAEASKFELDKPENKKDPYYEQAEFSYRSPVSGSNRYKYSVEDKLWLCVRDGHDLRGIITRDLIRHSMGLPTF